MNAPNMLVDEHIADPFVVISPPRPPTRRERIDEWRDTRDEVVTPQDAKALERQLSRGKLLARERIEQLLDPGSFQELQMMTYTVDIPLLKGKQAYGDGIVAGWGTMDGNRTFVFSQDATVVGGSLGEIGGAKVARIIDLAIDAGAPVVGILDGGGARIQEAVASLNAFGGIFFRNTKASGVVPQISLIMGVAAGGAVYSPALTDFVFMVEGESAMAITGPKVVKEVTGEDVTLDELGGAAVHSTKSGVVHFVVPDEASCLDSARRLLSFLPQNSKERPRATTPLPPRTSSNGWDPFDRLPAELDTPYEVRRIIAALVDAGDIFEYAERWAPNVVCGYARLDGRPIGVVANQPKVRGGQLDTDACEKAARFIRTCDAYNVPLVTIVDSPGFVASVAEEHHGLIRSAGKLIFAQAESTSPHVHLITGRALGQAAVAMGATRAMSDVCLAWPTADIATVGPYEAAKKGTIDRVIEPQETRATLIDALAMLAGVERPPIPRKHENMPL